MTSTGPYSGFDPGAWLHPRTPLARARLVLLVSLTALTVAAWTVTLRQTEAMPMPMGIAARVEPGDSGMAGMTGKDDMAMLSMPVAGWSVAAAAVFVGVWAVMMAAMMLPAAAPMLLAFAAVQAGRSGRSIAVPTWLFAAGYLVVWTGAGLAVYALVQTGSDLATRLDAAERATWAPVALGLVLAGAGLYQFTPLKRVCLSHCRSPLSFVMGHWQEGRLGALRMGVRHGAYCLGCCWALFIILVATRVMSLAWMLLLTLVVFAEKVLPRGGRTAAAIGALIIVLGVLVAGGAVGMPWLA